MADEVFTTYTNFTDKAPDPLSISATTITGTAVDRNQDTYVYDSKGAAHFSGDIAHKMDTKQTNVSGQGVIGTWSLTNDIDDIVGLRAGSKSFLHMQFNGGTTYILFENYIGTSYNDFNASLTDGVEYFLTIERDESIGTYGQLTCKIYSNISRTTLVDTLSLLLHAKLDFQYVWGLMSHDDNNGGSCDITVSNLDLGEGVITGNPWYYYAQQ